MSIKQSQSEGGVGPVNENGADSSNLCRIESENRSPSLATLEKITRERGRRFKINFF